MNLDKMIQELAAERDAISAAIGALERIAYTHSRRRGRPPAWLQVQREVSQQVQTPTKRRRKMSPETRKKMAESQRKRWAAAAKDA